MSKNFNKRKKMPQDIPGVDDDPGEEQDYDDLEDDFFAPVVIDPQEQRIYEADYLKDDSYIKLLKANSVIRGKVVADKRGLKINIYDLKVLNFLLKNRQKNLVFHLTRDIIKL